ncbi:dihydropteroate synthase [Streptococcus pyogenes]|uniref:dihydropteroate synthase n=1 Tax=Streptococcus pyogenes TaxID=1314 RepID=UPI0010A16C1D|nr:dihydropteroate synthase [Streptococcus pyogenes]VHC88527.1 dihydropteroate synthase [Streptococcus pyogenes]HER0083408.1 dihydropteroate synthase [Streptococcus pyogenes]HER1065634.1 dihydropteroate synthase [Streptococcus pyogenes]HER1505998.1 dihydropteroate synthase [Streptococcus pyogenes]HER1710851.1 dihydropteroate synthase [Streptococcus pyogenes]
MKIGRFVIEGNAAIMGILNVTPDSFSDGGSYTTVQKALDHVEQMIAGGAKIIDVGGESNRPGYQFVSVAAADEIERVVPMIKAIKAKYDVLISIDTYKTETARAALEAGADILNDVWAGLYDGEMLALAAEYDVPIILMHNQKEEVYQDVTQDVCDFLSARAQAAIDAGVPKDNIWIDPGFGFAKSVQHNMELLKGLDRVCQLGYPVLFGISRKRVVDALLGGNTKAKERDGATAALSAYALGKGCQLVRVHDVKANQEIVAVLSQLM